MFRQFFLTLSLLASSAIAVHAQAGCPPNPPPYPYVNAVSTAPATVYAYTPFTLVAQICNVPANTSYQLAVSITQQINMGPSLQTQVTVDASGIVSIPVGPQFPAGAYQALINGSPLPFAGNSLFFSIASPPPGPLNKLTGPFVFLFQGATTAALPPGASTQAAIAGSFASDGNGHITAGEADFNSPFGSSEQIPLTGSYNYDATGNGTLTFITSAGTQTFSLSIDPNQLTGLDAVTAAVFTGSPTGAFAGSGTLQPQTIPVDPFPYAYDSQLLAVLTGETPCDATYCVDAGDQALPLSTSASMFFSNLGETIVPFTAYPISFTATYDQTFGASVVTGLSETGTLSAPDIYGRSVLTITPPINYGSPSRFAVYVIQGQYYDYLYLLSLDPHDNAVLLSGEAYSDASVVP